MYLKYYGLKEKPFEITVDPRFLYLSASHKEALAHLVYAVQERRGFAVITGEVGTGKTTLIQTLLSRLDARTKTAFLFNPNVGSSAEFLYSICEDLEIKVEKGSKVDYLARLNEFLMECFSRKENVVVIIDEAHTLNPELLEEIRLLTNLETPSSKLLQVILLGQPELDNTLIQPQFLALKQRINVRYHLKPLNRDEMGEYILRRLRVAGARTTLLFTAGALRKIYRYSQGIPRLINIVCDNALTNGYASEKKIIDDEVVGEVVSDLEGISFRSKKKLLLLSAAAVMALLLLGALYLYGPGEILETARVFLGKIWHQTQTGPKGALSLLEEILLTFLS